MFALLRNPFSTALSSLRELIVPGLDVDEDTATPSAPSSRTDNEQAKKPSGAEFETLFEPEFGDDARNDPDCLSLSSLDISDPRDRPVSNINPAPRLSSPTKSAYKSKPDRSSSIGHGRTPRPFPSSFAYVEIPIRHDTSRSSKILNHNSSPSKSTPSKATLTKSPSYKSPSYKTTSFAAEFDTSGALEAPDEAEEVLSAYAPSSADSADENTSPLGKARRGVKKPACCHGCTALDGTASKSRHTTPHSNTGQSTSSPTKRKSVGGDKQAPKRGRPSLKQSNTDSATPKKGKAGKTPIKRRTSAPAALLLQEEDANVFEEFGGSSTGKSTLASRMKPKKPRNSTNSQKPKATRKGRKPDVWVRGAADDSASDSDEQANQPESFDAFWARVQRELPQARPPTVDTQVSSTRRPKTYAEVEVEAYAVSSSSRWGSSPASMDEGASTQSTPADTEDMAHTPALDVSSFGMGYPPYSFDLPPDSIRELAIAALAATKPPDELFSHSNYDPTDAFFDPALMSNEALVMPFKYQPPWLATNPSPATSVPETARAHEHHENVAEALAAFINIEGE